MTDHNKDEPISPLAILDLLRKLYEGPQEGSAVYEAARLDAGRLLRILKASPVEPSSDTATPRTDKEAGIWRERCVGHVTADFARQLEREASALAARVKELEASKERIQSLHVGLMQDADDRYMQLYGESLALTARVKRLEDALLARGAMDDPPCFICGYNGPGYYTPSRHACAHRCNLIISQPDAAKETLRALSPTDAPATTGWCKEHAYREPCGVCAAIADAPAGG